MSYRLSFQIINFYNSLRLSLDFSVISPKPIDQDPQENMVGIIVAVFVAIILILVGVIVVIITRHKKASRSDMLGTLPHTLHQDSLTIDKRMNYNIKVSAVNDGSRAQITVVFSTFTRCRWTTMSR